MKTKLSIVKLVIGLKEYQLNYLARNIVLKLEGEIYTSRQREHHLKYQDSQPIISNNIEQISHIQNVENMRH